MKHLIIFILSIVTAHAQLGPLLSSFVSKPQQSQPTQSYDFQVDDNAVGSGNNQIVYSPNWVLAFKPGQYGPGGTYHYSDTDSAYFQITFIGNRIDWYAERYNN